MISMSISPWSEEFYLEHGVAEIEHYGVKGMKWKQHLKKATDKLSDTIDELATKPSKETFCSA